MKIKLNSCNGYGVNYARFVIENPLEFTWEEGKSFAEKHIDNEILKYNKKADKYNKKNHTKCMSLYQRIRDGPIIHARYGRGNDDEKIIYQQPKKFNDEWFCVYRYKNLTNDDPPIYYWDKEKKFTEEEIMGFLNQIE